MLPAEPNPWVPVVPEEQSPAVSVATAPSYVRLGPSRPQAAGVSAPEHGGLPVWTAPQQALWWWVSCHGGAGTSTLDQAVPGGADAGTRGWPQAPSGAGGRTAVVLVARTHARGIQAAQEAARQWASGAVPGVDLLGLVAVADAPGKLPRALRDAMRFVAGGVPRLWQVPWVEQWRVGVAPPSGPRVTAAVKLAADLARLVSYHREL